MTKIDFLTIGRQDSLCDGMPSLVENTGDLIGFKIAELMPTPADRLHANCFIGFFLTFPFWPVEDVARAVSGAGPNGVAADELAKAVSRPLYIVLIALAILLHGGKVHVFPNGHYVFKG